MAEGMVRACLVEYRVAGVGHQAVNALHSAQAPPGSRRYRGPGLPQFRFLKQQLQGGWIELLRKRVGLARAQLPLLGDGDFMPGDRAPGAAERFVLCEINVSSVSSFAPSAIAPLVEAVKAKRIPFSA